MQNYKVIFNSQKNPFRFYACAEIEFQMDRNNLLEKYNMARGNLGLNRAHHRLFKLLENNYLKYALGDRDGRSTFARF
jgi:hypothetical protein